MSKEFFQSRIGDAMRGEGKEPVVASHAIGDFMKAAAGIETLEDAQRFYRGAVDWDKENLLGESAGDIVDGNQRIVLQAVERISDPSIRSVRRRMWNEVFGTYDDLIKRKEIVNY